MTNEQNAEPADVSAVSEVVPRTRIPISEDRPTDPIAETADQTEPAMTEAAQEIQSPRAEFERQFSTFVFLWSTASLVVTWNELTQQVPIAMPKMLLCGFLAAASLLAMARPANVTIFISLVSTHVLHGFYLLPMSTDIQFFWWLVNSGILLSYVAFATKLRSTTVGASHLLTSFSPCVRWLTVIFIGFSALSKYNLGFLNIESSTVAIRLRELAEAGWLAALPTAPWAQYLAVSATITIESVLAVSLVMPRFRLFGVGLGSTYFLLQSLLGCGEGYGTAAILFATLYRFATPEVTDRLYRWKFRSPIICTAAPIGMAVLAGMVFASAVALHVKASIPHAPGDAGTFPNIVLLLSGMLWLGALLRGLPESDRRRRAWVAIRMRNPMHYALAGVTVLAAVSPYLGWRTHPAFTAGSNLRTEAQATNHLFMPQFYLAGFQNDLVEVLESNDPLLQRFADTGQLLTWFELVNHTSRHPDISLAFARNGQVTRTARVGDSEDLSQPHPWFLRKLLCFRPVNGPILRRQGPSVAAADF